MPQFPKETGRVIAALVAAIGGIASLVWLFRNLTPMSPGTLDWSTLAKFAVAVGVAFGVTAMLRFALAPLVSREAPAVAPADADVALRSRIAPLVLATGSAAIIVLALGLIIAFAVLAGQGNEAVKTKIDTLLTGVFSAVLPVFATWVGTVIAFYFANESFRQAAQATLEAAAGAGSAQPKVTDHMIPYEKIAKIVAARATARATDMARVMAMFNDQVTRVIVFDEPSRQPIFILRAKSPPMPAAWLTALPPNTTIDDYLKQNGNAQDAAQFGFIAQSATLDAARTAMRDAKCADLFVTATGQKTEPVIGWLTDDLLK
jgi:hypothetical protein